MFTVVGNSFVKHKIFMQSTKRVKHGPIFVVDPVCVFEVNRVASHPIHLQVIFWFYKCLLQTILMIFMN